MFKEDIWSSIFFQIYINTQVVNILHCDLTVSPPNKSTYNLYEQMLI